MNLPTRRLSSAIVLAVLCACTVGAGLAWACAPANWGWTPSATPESTPTAGGKAPAASPGPAPSGTLPPAEATPSEPAAQSEPRQPTERRAGTRAKHPARSSAEKTPSGASAPLGVAAGLAGDRRAQSPSAVVGRPQSSGPASSGRGADGRRGEGNGAKDSTRSTETVQAATDGEAWSGGDAKGVSLVSSAGDSGVATVTSAGSQLRLGAGLLGLGLVGLLGGLAVAGARRRRSLALRWATS